MGSAVEPALFSYTVENRFVFNLFDVLLCGVIGLVVLRGWWTARTALSVRRRLVLLLAFSVLGASFVLGGMSAGAVLFFQSQLRGALFEAASHALRAGAWLLVAVSVYLGAARVAWDSMRWSASRCSPASPRCSCAWHPGGPLMRAAMSCSGMSSR